MPITVTFSDTAGSPGRRRQLSRMISSTSTPACDARYSASTISASSSALHLNRISPVPPPTRWAISRSILASSAFFIVVGAASNFR